MLTSQILVALLTTAGIVESRERWGGLRRWMSLLDKERVREEWLWTIRRKARDLRVFKYSGTKKYQISVAPESRKRVCDFVVMLTSHPVHVTHPALVTKPRTGSTRLCFFMKLLGQRSAAKNRRVMLSAAEALSSLHLLSISSTSPAFMSFLWLNQSCVTEP